MPAQISASQIRALLELVENDLGAARKGFSSVCDDDTVFEGLMVKQRGLNSYIMSCRFLRALARSMRFDFHEQAQSGDDIFLTYDFHYAAKAGYSLQFRVVLHVRQREGRIVFAREYWHLTDADVNSAFAKRRLGSLLRSVSRYLTRVPGVTVKLDEAGVAPRPR
ncbi:nuclear transport factor 2 family protein [Sorangium sp. So ce269]